MKLAADCSCWCSRWRRSSARRGWRRCVARTAAATASHARRARPCRLAGAVAVAARRRLPARRGRRARRRRARPFSVGLPSAGRARGRADRWRRALPQPIFSLAAVRKEPRAGTSALRWRPQEAHPSRGQPVTNAVRASRSARAQSRQGADRSFELAAMDDPGDAPSMPFVGGQLVGAHRPVEQTRLADPQSPPRRTVGQRLVIGIGGHRLDTERVHQRRSQSSMVRRAESAQVTLAARLNST